MSSDNEKTGGNVSPNRAERKEKRLWPLALLLTLFVLAGGGYYALTSLKDTAHKMGSGEDYDQLAANSSIYGGTARGDQRGVFAAGNEPLASAASAGSQTGRLNPGLIRSKEELVAAANARSGGGRSGAYGSPEEEEASAQDYGPGAAPGAGKMGSKLKVRAGMARGKGAMNSKGRTAGKSEGFIGSGSKVGKATVQKETTAGNAKKGKKAGGLEALKSAFKASLYGARIASNDSAKNWSARAFDAAEEAGTAIEYDEQVKAKLDRINPNSIPRFLKDMDVSADEAKRLANSDVSSPKMDKDGTYDSLKKDSGYQSKKLASDFAGSMINGLFAGVSGTGSDAEAEEAEEGGDYTGFSSPEEEAEFSSMALGEYMDTAGYGAECGCTEDSPCCCLPQDYFQSDAASQNECPMYGPFLPDDPCGASFYGEGETTGAVSAGI